MREFGIALTKALRRGLRPTVETGPSPEFLVVCHNQMPSEAGLRPHETIIEPVITLPGMAPIAPNLVWSVGPVTYVLNALSPLVPLFADVTALGVFPGGTSFDYVQFAGLSGFDQGVHNTGNQILVGVTPGSVFVVPDQQYTGGLEVQVFFIGSAQSPVTRFGTYLLHDNLGQVSNIGNITLNVVVI